MLATKEVLQFEAEAVAMKARTILTREGHLAPVAFFFKDNMSNVAMVPVELGNDEDNVRVRRFLIESVKQETPEAVVVVYQTMGILTEDDEEAETIAMLEEHPKKKVLLNIEAASPTAEHGLMIVYGVKDKKLKFEDECIVDEKDRCKFTRGLWGVVN
jgi:hypothetical protein